MAENVKKGTRDIIQFISSLITLIAGIVLVFLGFFAVPIGVIDYTVITAFGLFLSFVGAVWHIDLKYDFKTREIEREIKKDKDGSIIYSLHWEHYFKHIVQKYNGIYKI